MNVLGTLRVLEKVMPQLARMELKLPTVVSETRANMGRWIGQNLEVGTWHEETPGLRAFHHLSTHVPACHDIEYIVFWY